MGTNTSQPPSPSASPSSRTEIVTGLLTFMGITFASALVSILNKDPLQGLLVAGLCLIALALITFARQVGLQLQNLWVEDTAKWVDKLVRRKWISYQNYYARFLTFQHRDFDIKGLSTQSIYTLELDQVFVDLSIDPKALHETTNDPLLIKPTLDLLAGKRSIWSYLESEVLQNQHLVILGPPGSGKTTLLKHLALTLINQKKRRLLSQQLQRSYRISFLLFLREHAQAIQSNPSFSLVDAIESRLAEWERPAPKDWVQHQLSKGKCLLLLDGLDEVADLDSRERVVKWVQTQITKYAQNRFLLSSRPFGYRANPLNGVMVLEVQPFTFEQIRQFVEKWYLANEIMSSQKDDMGVRIRAKTAAQDLIQRIQRTPALNALAVNPLLLTMIATIHRYRSSLPGKRVELYGEICEVFLGKRQQARDQHIDLRPAQSISVLQPLAYTMMVRNQREITLKDAEEVIKEPLALVSGKTAFSNGQMSPSSFLQMVENMSGLLLAQKTGSYSFAHLTFQEYLAATYICEQKLEGDLLTRVDQSWWAETIRLYSAQADATQIIETCLSQMKPSKSSVPLLELALDCNEEALKVHPTLKPRLDEIIQSGADNDDPSYRRFVAEILLQRRIKEMIPTEREMFRDTSLILCAEYQLFLDEQYPLGNIYQPDHWKSKQFPPGEAFCPVLGISSSAAQAFCSWLTTREHAIWWYRLPASEDYLPEMIHARPEWLSLPSWKGFYGCWGNQGTFIWLRKPSDKEVFPLDLDPNKIPKSTIELGKDMERLKNFSNYLMDAGECAREFMGTFSRATEISNELFQASKDARNLANIPTIINALTNISKSVLALALAYARDIEEDNAGVGETTVVLIQPGISKLLTLCTAAFDIANDIQALAPTILSISDDIRTLTSNEVTILDQNLYKLYQLADKLTHASDTLLNLSRASSIEQAAADFFAFANLFSLLSICASFSAYEACELIGLQPKFSFSIFSWQSFVFRRRKNKKDSSKEDLPRRIQYQLSREIDINHSLKVLGKRKKGNEPAYEGLFIIREHNISNI